MGGDDARSEGPPADGPRFPDPESANVLRPGCARCPALVESRTRISWGNGPPSADVVVVGEAPGAGDPEADHWKGGNHTGLAYTSRHSGRRVRRLVADLGYEGRAYYTNAVKCFPRKATDDGRVTNREPTAEERANCRGHLATELDQVDPAVVLATGKHATRSVLALEGRDLAGGFLDAVLDPVALPTVGTTLLPLLHPSYQEVWLARLGYDEAEYRSEIAGHLP